MPPLESVYLSSFLLSHPWFPNPLLFKLNLFDWCSWQWCPSGGKQLQETESQFPSYLQTLVTRSKLLLGLDITANLSFVSEKQPLFQTSSFVQKVGAAWRSEAHKYHAGLWFNHDSMWWFHVKLGHYSQLQHKYFW